MFVFFLVLAGLSVVVLIVGGIWTLVLSGQTRWRSGPEVGAEIMADQMTGDSEGRVVSQHTFFKGKAVAVEREAVIDFAEVKQQLAAGRCLYTIPALLTISGFMGLLFFGAVAALLGMPNILIGGAIAFSMLYVLVRMGIAFIRA